MMKIIPSLNFHELITWKFLEVTFFGVINSDSFEGLNHLELLQGYYSVQFTGLKTFELLIRQMTS